MTNRIENKTSQPILIVEDSDDDFEYTKRAFVEANLANPIFRCEDGDEALDFMYHRGQYNAKNAPRPGLILLDLNMPGIDGEEVLETLKADEKHRETPIIVLTTSSQGEVVEKCYSKGADTYITKPIEAEKFFAAIKRLKDYYFEIALLTNTKGE